MRATDRRLARSLRVLESRAISGPLTTVGTDCDGDGMVGLKAAHIVKSNVA